MVPPPTHHPWPIGTGTPTIINECCGSRYICAHAADILLDGVWEVEEEPVALEDGEGNTRLVRTRLAAEDVSKQYLT